jgi:hypothetical protein
MKPERKRVLGFAALGGAIALHALMVMAVAVDASKLNMWPSASLQRMLSGTAENPFGQRVLLPWAIGLIEELTPASLESAIETRCAASSFGRYLIGHVFVPNDLAFEALLELTLMYACLIGFAWFLFFLARALFPDAPACAVVAPFLGLGSVTPWWHELYMYDFATLFVWSACLYYLYTQRWDRYVLWFTLGMLNRETTVLLLLPYLAYGWRVLPAKRLRTLAVIQGALAFVVKLSLLIRYAGNQGDIARWDPTGQITHFLVARYNLDQWVIFLGVVVLLTYRWDQKPVFLKCALLPFLPLFAAYLLAGRPGEYRVFVELIPAVSLLAVHTIVAWSGVSGRPSPMPSQGSLTSDRGI